MCGCGVQHCPLGLHALWGLRAAGVVGGRLWEGWPSTVVRGVWCQALSLPRPPVLWGGQPGFRDPCVPGAVGLGVGAQHRPYSVRPCRPSLCPLEVAEGRPRRAAFRRCGGRLSSGAPPPPAARPLGGPSGSATHVLWVRVCGCGGPALSPWVASPWGLRAAGVVGGRPRGGWTATVVRGVWCQALSLSRPPVLWGGRPGFRDPCVPGAVGVGVGTQHGPHSVRPCEPSLRAVGVAEGRPRGGALRRCGGSLSSGAPPPPTAHPLGRAAGVPRPVSPGCEWCGCGDPAPAPQRAPLQAVVARCRGGGGASPGGGAFGRCEGRLGSGNPPHPAACPLSGLSGSATDVLWARVCGCQGPAPAPWLACPLGGCAARGWCGASGFRCPPFPGCSPSWRAAGARWPRAVGAAVGVCGVCGVCAVRAVVRDAAFRLSPWGPPLR